VASFDEDEPGLELEDMRPDADAVHQPLIGSDQHHSPDLHDDAGYDSDGDKIQAVDEADLGAPGLFIWTLVLGSALSGLLFGYEYVEPLQRCSDSNGMLFASYTLPYSIPC
jgi:hypothetical protein